jgi:hypothetical protein
MPLRPRKPFDPQLVARIRPHMEEENTERLLTIYKDYDVSGWSQEAFQAIRYILIERGQEIPQPDPKLCPACGVSSPGHALECECGYDFTVPLIIEDVPKPFVAHCNLLQFKCDQEWESLDVTNTGDIRYCRKCDHRVYLCRTEGQFRYHASMRNCVAITVMNPSKPKSEIRTAGIPRRPRPE